MHPNAFWPAEAPLEESIEAFCIVFGTLGYVLCDTATWEAGFEKVALYVKADRVTHAARQLVNGQWTSKLGQSLDCTHTLEGLVGPLYGDIACFLKRKRGS
jgi:hypothetical protein